MKVTVGILDMDGTLFRGFLATHMADALRCIPGRAGSARRARQAIEDYKAGLITHDECATRFYDAYASAVRGLPAKLMQRLATTVWLSHRTGLFPHATGLVDLVRELGLLSCLISGSPEEVIALAAAELRIEHWWGLTVGTRAGLVTGEILRAPACRGGKNAVLTELSHKIDIDWARSLAIGDSAADVEVLDMVGHPIAFEPDPQLQEIAQHRGWTITHRHNVLSRTRTLLRRTETNPSVASAMGANASCR